MSRSGIPGWLVKVTLFLGGQNAAGCPELKAWAQGAAQGGRTGGAGGFFGAGNIAAAA
jgi:hypothetical protein